jgi:hypothetical protein
MHKHTGHLLAIASSVLFTHFFHIGAVGLFLFVATDTRNVELVSFIIRRNCSNTKMKRVNSFSDPSC